MESSEVFYLIAVWSAVEGDPTKLVTLLRSDIQPGRMARDALADWLEGRLQPMQLPKGRPPKVPKVSYGYQLLHHLRGIPLHLSLMGDPYELFGGHDPETALGRAGMEFDSRWSYIRKKGWHLKGARRLHWSSERLRSAVAERNGIDHQSFTNYLNRHRKKPNDLTLDELVEATRREIAFEIRHAKISSKG